MHNNEYILLCKYIWLSFTNLSAYEALDNDLGGAIGLFLMEITLKGICVILHGIACHS